MKNNIARVQFGFVENSIEIQFCFDNECNRFKV